MNISDEINLKDFAQFSNVTNSRLIIKMQTK